MCQIDDANLAAGDVGSKGSQRIAHGKLLYAKAKNIMCRGGGFGNPTFVDSYPENAIRT
jgi:hypothetical protein